MKSCTKCNKVKPLSDFHNCKSKPSGKFSACKICRNYCNSKKSKEIGYDVLYKKALEKNNEKYKQKKKEYYQKNKDSIKEKSKAWSLNNVEKKAQSNIAHYEKNKDQYIERAREWGRNNADRRKEICKNYSKKLREDDPARYVATNTARKMLSRVINSTGAKKLGRTYSALGYNKDDFVKHIELQFDLGMSWQNHGKWHVDHIIPISTLVKCGVFDPAKINSLDNLRPIWAHENNSKHANFELSSPETAHITRASK